MLKLSAVFVALGMMSSGLPAIAADLAAPASAVTPESDAFSWSGGYIGLNAGYTWSHSDGAYVNSPFTLAGPIILDPVGGFGGVTLGANQQLDSGIVLGLEADAEYGDVTATIPDVTGHPGDTITSKTDWSGTVRGRVGFATGKILPYLTAGMAVANASVSATDGNLSDSAVLVGWTAGGGIEVALDDNWSVKGEYLYTDLGTHTWFASDPWASTSHSTSSTVRVGINYGF